MAVLAAIQRLPEAYRETLVLRLVEGMTGPEIAERTGLTPGSVRVNLHRGMQMLREALAGATGRERRLPVGRLGEPDPEIQRLERRSPLRGTRRRQTSARGDPLASSFGSGGPWPRRRRGAGPGRGHAPAPLRAGHARGWDLAWLEGASWPRRAWCGRPASAWASGSTPERPARLAWARSARCSWSRPRGVGLAGRGDRSHRLSLAARDARDDLGTPGAVLVKRPRRWRWSRLPVHARVGGRRRRLCAWTAGGLRDPGLRRCVPPRRLPRGARSGGTPYLRPRPRRCARRFAEIDFGTTRARGPPPSTLRSPLLGARRALLWHLLSRLDRRRAGSRARRLAVLFPHPRGHRGHPAATPTCGTPGGRAGHRRPTLAGVDGPLSDANESGEERLPPRTLPEVDHAQPTRSHPRRVPARPAPAAAQAGPP